MTYSDDWNDDMVLLDNDTADRLVRGAVAPDDAPPGYADVAALFRDLREEPVVIDDHQVWAVTTAVQSAVGGRARVRSARRARLRLPAAVAGGVAIAMLVAPVAARIARDIDLVGTNDNRGADVVTPANSANDDAGTARASSNGSAGKQHSRAATTPAAERAAVTVPVASDAPAQPDTPASDAVPAGDGTAADTTVVAKPEPSCVRGAEAAAKPDRACPGERRAPEDAGSPAEDDTDADTDAEPDTEPEQRGRPAR